MINIPRCIRNRSSRRETYVALAADHLVAVVLAGQRLERWLDDTTTETEDKVESGFLSVQLVNFSNPYKSSNANIMSATDSKLLTHLLDVVVGKGAAVLQLLAREDQALLVRWNAFLVLNLGFDIVDCVARFDLEGDGLTRQGLDEAVGFISG